MAYCFITIPSMTDIFTRLKLYLLSGQTALANHAIGQGLFVLLGHCCYFTRLISRFKIQSAYINFLYSPSFSTITKTFFAKKYFATRL